MHRPVDVEIDQRSNAAPRAAVAEYSVGMIVYGDRAAASLYLGRADGTGTTHVMSFASLVKLCEDISGFLESEEALNALVRETLRHGRELMVREASDRREASAVVDEVALVAIDDRETLPADQLPPPRPGLPGIALGLMGDGGPLWCCSNPDGCGICRGEAV